MSLNGKNVIVIGGTSGIGLAVAARAAADGAVVTVASSSQDRIDAALKELPDTARGARLDVTDEAAIAEFFGTQGEFDHLVYTAGEALLLAPIDAISAAQADAFFGIRYRGAFLAAKYAAAHVRSGGSITFTSGTVATRPGPGTALPASVTAAVEGLTRALAVELAPVRVNAVRPGPVRTTLWDGTVPDPQAVYDDFSGRIPVGRIADPDEIAAAYAYLIGNHFTTGTVLTVDGGTVLA
ncbi:SDR family oxidoreductase [Nocardia sp. NPDC088792]|uniref:SDR family oxidoreductase n=1 Tax=Nocardia sp. NPDC088792 TaxID=3364332 RepID=UPI00380B1996